jgi:hypothetical protein
MSQPVWHPDLELVSGDSWSIAGNLLDTTGQPLDLTAAGLEWTLIAPGGTLAIPAGSAVVAVTDPPTSGAIVITVDKEITKALDPGRYIDSLRVTIAGLADTMWRGCVLVDADLIDITA